MKLTESAFFGFFLKLKLANFFWSIFWGTVFTVFATWYVEGIPVLSIQTAAGFVVGWVFSVSFVFFLLSQGSYQQPSSRDDDDEEQTEKTSLEGRSKIEQPRVWKPDLPDFLPIDRVDELVERTLEKEPIEDR